MWNCHGASFENVAVLLLREEPNTRCSLELSRSCSSSSHASRGHMPDIQISFPVCAMFYIWTCWLHAWPCMHKATSCAQRSCDSNDLPWCWLESPRPSVLLIFASLGWPTMEHMQFTICLLCVYGRSEWGGRWQFRYWVVFWPCQALTELDFVDILASHDPHACMHACTCHPWCLYHVVFSLGIWDDDDEQLDEPMEDVIQGTENQREPCTRDERMAHEEVGNPLEKPKIETPSSSAGWACTMHSTWYFFGY